MSDFLTNLVARSLGQGQIVRPLLAPLFGVPQRYAPRLASTDEPSKPEARSIDADTIVTERLASSHLPSVKSRSTTPILGMEDSRREAAEDPESTRPRVVGAGMPDSSHERRAEDSAASTEIQRKDRVASRDAVLPKPERSRATTGMKSDVPARSRDKTEPFAVSEAEKEPLSVHHKPTHMSAQGPTRLAVPATITEYEPKAELPAVKNKQEPSLAATPIPIGRLAAVTENPHPELGSSRVAENRYSSARQQAPVVASLLVPHLPPPVGRTDQPPNTHGAVRAPVSVRVRAVLPSAPNPMQPAAALPTINVTIGRVEVRAVSATQTPKRERERLTALSLQDYLHRRSRGDA